MSRHPLAVAIGLFIIGWGTNVATPFMVRYRDRLELGDNATQLIFVIYVAGILGSLLLAGQLSDRFGRRRLLLPSLIASAVASLIIIAGRDDFTWLLTGRVLLGVVSGTSLGVGAAWLQELLGPGSERRAAVITTVATYGGFGIGPPISMLWDLWLPSSLIGPFVLHAALSVGAIALLWSVPETATGLTPVDSSADQGDRWKPTIRLGVPASERRPFWLVLAPAAVWVFAFPSTGFALFPVLVSDAVDLSDAVVPGLAGAITAWAGLGARPLGAAVAERWQLPVGLAIGATGYIFGTVAWTTGAWPLVWPASFLLGLASGTVSTACLTMVATLSDDDSRGALTSTFYVLAYLGMAMPLFVTAVGSLIGTEATLITITVAALATAASHPTRRRMAG